MSEHLKDFERFMQTREAAARAYVNGDAAPLGRLVAHTAPASFFGPDGAVEQGAPQVYALYERDARRFGAGQGETSFEVLHMAADGALAYWVGLQRALLSIDGGLQQVPMTLRVTEVFRRVGQEWKLVHRHADPLAETAAPGM